MKLKITFLLLLLGQLGFAQNKATSNKQSTIDKLKKLITAYAEYGNFSGSVLVADKGGVIYKKGFGLANMEWGIPNKPDTRHKIASMSKEFTSMLVLQLVAENKLKLDAPISTYLPDYPKKTGDIITIHQLLTHSSGIPNFTSFPGFRKTMSSYFSPAELVASFADSALEFKPGEKFDYSNSGYVLLGVIIEKVTGKSYKQVLQEQIFTPLGMTNSGADEPNTIIKNRSSGYYHQGLDYQNANYINMSVSFSAGYIYSTVEDLYLWDRALYTEKLLPKKYMDMLFQKHMPDGRGYYGYGWEINEMRVGNTNDRVQTIGHDGTINGYCSLITRILSDDLVVVLLNNTGEAPLYEMTVAINGILHDKPYDMPRKSLAYALLKKIKKDGLASAPAYYASVKDSHDYKINETEMNYSGYDLLHAGKAKEAAYVFKLNTEAFPNSYNAYDSYAETLLATGDKDQAITNYLKSVRLNPLSESGLDALKKLGVNTDTLFKKVSLEYLRSLEGKYLWKDGDKEWNIEFKVVNGTLMGSDRGYEYKVLPVADNTFVNPDDGASIVFDTNDKKEISVVLFGRVKFKKVN